jgi:dihydroorotate dehydrogenase (fumarate)
MTDLTTRYLGLELDCPIVASAGPLTGRIDTLRRLESAGVGAVVLPSLFEEEIERAVREHERILGLGTDSFAPTLHHLPDVAEDRSGVDRHLRLVAEAKAALDIPVIASLNGSSNGGWTSYARALVDAGADALELNVYFVAAAVGDTASDIEDRYEDLVATVSGAVRVPLAVKVSPFFTALTNVAHRIQSAGADGLVLFNRFYQPDIDVDRLAVTSSITLSTSADLRLPLRWIGILRDGIAMSLAASSGVHTPTDVVKALLAGADVAMATSALLRHGPEHVTTLRDGLTAWLAGGAYSSVTQMRATLSAHAVPDRDAYERAGYVEALLRHADDSEPSSWS